MSRLKNIVKRSKSHKVLIENFSYLAFLQVFLLLYPFNYISLFGRCSR